MQHHTSGISNNCLNLHAAFLQDQSSVCMPRQWCKTKQVRIASMWHYVFSLLISYLLHLPARDGSQHPRISQTLMLQTPWCLETCPVSHVSNEYKFVGVKATLLSNVFCGYDVDNTVCCDWWGQKYCMSFVLRAHSNTLETHHEQQSSTVAHLLEIIMTSLQRQFPGPHIKYKAARVRFTGFQEKSAAHKNGM